MITKSQAEGGIIAFDQRWEVASSTGVSWSTSGVLSCRKRALAKSAVAGSDGYCSDGCGHSPSLAQPVDYGCSCGRTVCLGRIIGMVLTLNNVDTLVGVRTIVPVPLNVLGALACVGPPVPVPHALTSIRPLVPNPFGDIDDIVNGRPLAPLTLDGLDRTRQ